MFIAIFLNNDGRIIDFNTVKLIILVQSGKASTTYLANGCFWIIRDTQDMDHTIAKMRKIVCSKKRPWISPHDP